MYTTIKTFLDKGYSKSQITKMLEIDKGTVREILKYVEKEKKSKERVFQLSLINIKT